MTRSGLAAFALICAITTSLSAYAQGTEPHGWLNTETLKTRSGDFEFKNGYPVGDTAATIARSAKIQSSGRGLSDADDAGERDCPARRSARVRCEKADTGRDLGKPDGRPDRAADRQHRDGLCASAISS